VIGGLPGISGTLFPRQFLANSLRQSDGERPHSSGPSVVEAVVLDHQRRRFDAWWRRLAATCGPATGIRSLFDLAAMPLSACLGFRARTPTFDRQRAHVILETPAGVRVVLLIRPWAERPPELWKEVVSVAQDSGASWGFILAPPYLTLVDARGHSTRRALEFAWPDVLDPVSFPIFWTVAHARSFEVPADLAASPLDRWLAASDRFQDRVRADLQLGVIDAIGALVPAIGRGPVKPLESFQESLTIVYRILFLLFAESRDLVPRRHPIYRSAYTVGALCEEAAGSASASGLWESLAAITRLSRRGCRADDLIVQPFNGRLFARSAAPSLEAAPRSRRLRRTATSQDAAMQRALVSLGTRASAGNRESISYADLGVEQLGAVYERVLDIEPGAQDTVARTAPVHRRHSARRKETGTFYTPQALCDFVVRRTLAPLVSGKSADDILALRVVDPAMGSGAFLVAACRFLAGAYEHALMEEGRASAPDLDDAARADMRRLVAERCLAGVDANPVAVQLARLSLWLATLAEGKPLGFLDHRLRVGNSLIGASPDDLRYVRAPARSPVRLLELPLFDDPQLEDSIRHVIGPLTELARRRDDTVEDVRSKESVWTAIAGDRSRLRPWKLAASLWCARWFWPDGAPAAGSGRIQAPPAPAEIRAAIDGVLRGDSTLRASHLTQLLSIAERAGAANGFFHWPLEFADVFFDAHGQTRTPAGFDAVIGNPPWEMLRLDGPVGQRAPQHLVRFIRESGLYPSCDSGHVNLYQPFVERSLALTRPGGRVGLILPWGLAVDEGASSLRAALLDRTCIDTIVGLDNAGGLFPIHRGLRFMAIVTSPGKPTREIRARFGVTTTAEIASLPGDDPNADGTGVFSERLTARQIAQTGGSARRIPDLRRPGDLAFIERLTAAYLPLGSIDGWRASFGRELNATEDRVHFGSAGLPVIEGKHVSAFAVDVRAVQHRIARRRLRHLLPDGRSDRPRLAHRDVSGVANRMSLIAAIVPAGVATTHTLFCLRTPLSIDQQHFLCAVFNSYVLNAVARLLMGGHLTTGLVEGLPVPAWTGSARQRRMARLSRRLSEGTRDLAILARLQAAVAREFGLDEDTFAHVLGGFPLVPIDERQRAMAAFRSAQTRVRNHARS